MQNRYNVAPVVSGICNQFPYDLLTDTDVMTIYNKLYPYTQVDEIVKRKHIVNINQKSKSQPIQPIFKPPVQVITQNTTKKTPIAEITEPLKKEDANQPPLRCPKCNGNLILRTATRGTNVGKQFYGCSNYPRCKYIQNI